MLRERTAAGREHCGLGRSRCSPRPPAAPLIPRSHCTRVVQREVGCESGLLACIWDAARLGGLWFRDLRRTSAEKLRPAPIAEVGGPDRDRTGDLLNAIQARSQLRYRPIEDETTLYCSEDSREPPR